MGIFRARSFGTKVLVACLLSVGAALVVFSLSVYLYEKQASESRLEHQLTYQARILANTNKQGMDLTESVGLSDEASAEDKEAFREALRADETIVEAALFFNDGSTYLTYPEDAQFSSIPSSGRSAETVDQVAGLRVVMPVMLDEQVIGTVYLLGSREVLYERRVRYTQLLIVAGLLSVLIALVITYRLRRSLTKPITELVETATLVAENGDYSLRVKHVRDDELGVLAQHVNDMLSSISERDKQLSESERAVRDLNADLQAKNKELETVIYVTSHDLRTPLVNIQGFGKELRMACAELVELIGSGAGKDSPDVERILSEDIPEALGFIVGSSAKMGTLLSGLLRLSRLGTAAIANQPLEMHGMVQDILKTLEYQVKEAGVRITCNDLPPCMGDPMQVSQAFMNLIDNAVKFTKLRFGSELHESGAAEGERGLIEISACAEGDRVVYSIRDNGVGIDPAFHDKIFDIFNRLEPSKTEGEGLGLTITQRMIQRNGGEIWLESSKPGGTTVFVALPAINSDREQSSPSAPELSA